MFKFCLCFFCLFEGKLDEVYEALANAHPNMTVYKKEQIPDRLHYKHNSKIQPILAVADKGWEIVYNKSDGFQCKYSVFTVFYCIFLVRDLTWYFLSQSQPMLIFFFFKTGRENSESKCRNFFFFPDGMGSIPLLGEGELDLPFLKIKLAEIRSFTCFCGHILEVLRELANWQALSERFKKKKKL